VRVTALDLAGRAVPRRPTAKAALYDGRLADDHRVDGAQGSAVGLETTLEPSWR
jgi:hypothetical protein